MSTIINLLRLIMTKLLCHRTVRFRQRGERGNTGLWYDFAGVWGTDTRSVTNTAKIGYYVRFNGHFYMNICDTGVSNTTTPGTDATKWEPMADERRFFIARAYFGDYAEIGGCIINGDWMISRLPAADSPSQSYSDFDESHPNEAASDNFIPMLAINMRTGKIYANDAELKGKIIAASGTIGGFAIASDSISTKNASDVLSIKLNSDGSGLLGCGGISWDAAGNFTVTDALIDAVFKILATGYHKTYEQSGGTFFNSKGVRLADGKLMIDGQTNNVQSNGTVVSDGGVKVFRSQIGVTETEWHVEVDDSSIVLYYYNYDDTTDQESEKKLNITPDGLSSPESISIEAQTDLYLRSAASGSSWAGWIHLDNTGRITASGTITTTSDERLKDIIRVLTPDIEKIAKARIVDFSWKNSKTAESLGSIAQDWQQIFPNAVKESDDGFLSLDYPAAALASAVTAAREIVKLKKENAELKKRLEAIERKLGI